MCKCNSENFGNCFFKCITLALIAAMLCTVAQSWIDMERETWMAQIEAERIKAPIVQRIEALEAKP